MWTTMESPLGVVRVVAEEAGVTVIGFELPAEVTGPPHSSMSRAAARVGPPLEDRDDADPLLREAVRQLRAYFARELKEFDLPLAPSGTLFQQRVWAELRRIGYGETASYGEVATRLGMPLRASRAVGAANGRNPVAVVIPCHRVVGANGLLSGYAGGVERKRALLDLERGLLG